MQEKLDIVTQHNELRARLGACDMELMTWNESLAVAAANWVAQCNTRNAKTPLPGTSFTAYGQNHLYVIAGDKIDFRYTVQRWYNEKDNYALEPTWGCKPGRKCDHYTQVVWATSRQIGCAYHHCNRVNNAEKAEFLACNYLPAGNEQGQMPFRKGPPCSQCEGGAGWCNDGLCNSRCSKAGYDCSCKAICYNCAKLNLITCRCSCADGWYGPACSKRCEDKKGNSSSSSFNCTDLLPSSCNSGKDSSRIKRECPVMCELCKPNPNAKWGKCPPAWAKLVKPNSTDDNNGSQHQQQRITLILLSNVILSLTITWKALL